MTVVVAATSRALHLLLHLLLLLVATGGDVTFSITNRCSYTVWPASAAPLGGGVQLNPGQTWTLHVLNDTSTWGRIWARTGCSFDRNGSGTCQTGDCGGVLACSVAGQQPNTVAEFSLFGFEKMDSFGISLVYGFNVPMDFLPAPGQGCSKGPRCAANITSQCPSELAAPGGCNSACTVFKEDKYCCPGTGANNCPPTNYSLIFSRNCPDANTDNSPTNNTFSCPSGTNYQVVFCPPVDLAVAPSPAGSQTAPIGRLTSEGSSARSRVGVILAPLAGFISLAICF